MNSYLARKALLSLTLILFAFGQLIAQNTFFKTFDYSGNEIGNYVINTNDGGYAIIGKTNSLGSGAYDVWLLKTNFNGDTLWTKTYGGEFDDEGYCLRQTSDGGFIIAATKTIAGNYMDGWIFKTDDSGYLMWEYYFGGELNGERASFIVPTNDNNYMVTGSIDSKSYVCKIDESGNLIWEKTYFPNNSSGANAVCRTANNEYIVVGSFQMYSAGTWYPNIFRIDNQGELIYQLTEMAGTGGGLNCVTETSDQGFIYCGAWDSELKMKKFDADGFDQWDYSFTGVYMSTITSILETPDGNIVITDNSEDASLRKLNPDGDTLWTRHNSFGVDFPKYTCAQLTTDNGLIITGYGKNDAYNHEIVLVKTDLNGSMTGIENSTGESKLLFNQNSPNPFNNNTNLSFYLPKIENIELYISDTHGNKVLTIFKGKLSAGNHKYLWNGKNASGSDCTDGIYFATIKTSKGKIITRKLMKFK